MCSTQRGLFVFAIVLGLVATGQFVAASPPDLGVEGSAEVVAAGPPEGEMRAASPIGKWKVKGQTCLTVGGATECMEASDTFILLKRRNQFKTSCQTVDTKKGKWKQDGSKVKMQCKPGEMKKVVNGYLKGTGIEATGVKYWRYIAKMSGDTMKNGKLEGKFTVTYKGKAYPATATGEWTGKRVGQSAAGDGEKGLETGDIGE